MRFLELRLLAFGPFTSHTIDLAGEGGAPGLHVLHGRNEAGKSTALRAVAGLLFGIPPRTTDDHVHGKSELRIGARLEGRDGRTLDLVRRKGNKDTLLRPDGAKADEAALRRLLQGVSEEMFASMFGLDHERLRRGAEALLLGGGDVGESLFGAGLGGHAVHAVLARLQAEADEIFRPQAQNPKLNKDLKKYNDAKRDTQNFSYDASGWQKQRAGVEEAQRERDRLDERRKALKAEHRRLSRGKSALPFVAKRDSLLERRQALGDVLPLAAGSAERRLALETERLESAREATRLRDEIRRLDERRAALPVDEAVLRLEDERAHQLQDDLGAHRRAAADRPRLEGGYRTGEEEAREVLRRLGRAIPLEEVEPLRLETAAETRIRALSLRHAGLTEKQAAARRSLEAARVRRDQASRRLEALPRPSGSLEALARAVTAATAERDVATRMRARTDEIEAKEAKAARLVAELGRAGHAPAGVASLRVPSAETIARFESEEGAIALRLARTGERLSDLGRTIERARSEADAIRRDGGLEESDLVRTRARRDEGVRCLRDKAEGRAAAAEPKRTRGRRAPGAAGDPFDPDRPLGEAVEAAVTEADRVADALRAAANRLARLAAADEERARAEHEHARLDAERQEVERELGKAKAAWLALWDGTDLPVLPPAEMRSVPARHRELGALVESLEDDRRALRALGETRATLVHGLAAALAKDGDPVEPAGREALLDELLARALARLETHREAERTRRDLTAAIETLEAEIELRHREEEAETRAAAEWKSEWARSVAPLGLGADAVPEEASAVLGELIALFKKLDEARGLRRRIDGIERDARNFDAGVRSLLARHAPSLASLDVEDAAEELLARHRESRRNAKDAEALARERAAAATALAVAEVAASRADDELTALARAHGLGSLETLVAAELKAAEARDLERAIGEVETQLEALGDGLPLDRLGAEARAVDPLVAGVRLDELADEIREADVAFEAAVRDLTGAEISLRNMEVPDASTRTAAEAAAEAQAAATAVRAHAERWVRVHLAAVLLEREIERYRERNQGPLLKRASELFRHLTVGRYQALRTDYDESDRLVLRCVRAAGPGTGEPEVKGLDALSDGTRDQLFLALRIGALEHWLEANEPLPLVLDDVLIHFDDERARAALEVLGELALRTQVLFFTHHERLEELARKAVPESRLRVHKL